MNQKGNSLPYILLAVIAIILMGGVYLISSSRVNLKNPLSNGQPIYQNPSSLPSSEPTKTTISESVSCTTDEDCGINICACKAMNKAYIQTKDKICTRYCEGKPKCVNNKCELVKTVDPCKQFNEYSCSKTDNCKSNYEQVGPNRDAVGMPLANFKFTFCSSLTQEEIDRIKVESKNCTESGGTWTKTKGNPTGFCVRSTP